jgi:hypothetical protein
VQYGGRLLLLLGAPEVAADRELAARAGGKMPPKVREWILDEDRDDRVEA